MRNAFHKTDIERKIATNQVQASPVWSFSLADPVSHCLGYPDPNVGVLRSEFERGTVDLRMPPTTIARVIGLDMGQCSWETNHKRHVMR